MRFAGKNEDENLSITISGIVDKSAIKFIVAIIYNLYIFVLPYLKRIFTSVKSCENYSKLRSHKRLISFVNAECVKCSRRINRYKHFRDECGMCSRLFGDRSASAMHHLRQVSLSILLAVDLSPWPARAACRRMKEQGKRRDLLDTPDDPNPPASRAQPACQSSVGV